MGQKYMGLCILGFRFNFEMYIFVRCHVRGSFLVERNMQNTHLSVYVMTLIYLHQ